MIDTPGGGRAEAGAVFSSPHSCRERCCAGGYFGNIGLSGIEAKCSDDL